MKRLLLLLLLLLPVSVYAEDELPEHGFVDLFIFPPLVDSTIHGGYTYYYSTSYHYENGMYYLDNPVLDTGKNFRSSLYSHGYSTIYDNPFGYTCRSDSSSSCETLFFVYFKSFSTQNIFKKMNLKDGVDTEDIIHFKISDSFHKEGNLYVLDNPENSLIINTVTYDKTLRSKYFCENKSDRCEVLYNIEELDGLGLYVKSSDNDFIYGHGFDYQNGTYTLKDIVSSKWPNYKEYLNTYTCLSKSDKCEDLYLVTSFVETVYYSGGQIFNMVDKSHFTGNKIRADSKYIKIEKSDKFDVESYFTNSLSFWIQDRDIIKIKDNTIIPLKKGKTIVVIQKAEETILLHVEITDKDLINPITGVYLKYTLTTIIILITISFFIIKKIKKGTY